LLKHWLDTLSLMRRNSNAILPQVADVLKAIVELNGY
jgi:hypothetical protein